MIAIILTIAAIAIPRLLKASASAQESSAVATLRVITTAETTYITAYPNCGYVDMPALAGDGSSAAAAGILDNAFPVRDGYQFVITPVGIPGNCGVGPSGDSYSDQASPASSASSVRYLYSDTSGVIRYHFGGLAGPNDPVIQ